MFLFSDITFFLLGVVLALLLATKKFNIVMISSRQSMNLKDSTKIKLEIISERKNSKRSQENTIQSMWILAAIAFTTCAANRLFRQFCHSLFTI